MGRAYATYVSNPCCKRAAKDGDLESGLEFLLVNPTRQACRAVMTVYFADRAPHTFPPIQVAAESNHLLMMPDMDPAVFDDCGFWGAKIESDTYLIADPIGGMHYHHPDLTFKGCAPTFRSTDLHREWHFADGIWTDWKRFCKGDLAKAPNPFNELEYYYFLNPGPRDARVDMRLGFRNVEHETIHLTVPAERVRVWCNYEKIPYNEPYAVKVVSGEPITASAIRFIYGLNGLADWGLNARYPMAGRPGPIGA